MSKSIKKSFDSVQLMRQLRSEVDKEIGHLNRNQLKAYLLANVQMPRSTPTSAGRHRTRKSA